MRLRRFERAAHEAVLCLGWALAVTAFGTHAWGDENTEVTGSEAAATTNPTDEASVVPTWRDDKITLTVDPSYLALPYAREALAGAIQAWTSVASELPAVEIVESDVDGTALEAEQNRHDHRLSFAAEGEPKAKGALAITLVTVNTDEAMLIDADIVVNGGHHFTDVTTYPEGARGQPQNTYDLQNVLVHEFGHWFGLGEDYINEEATMYAYVDPFETKKRDLLTDDLTRAQLAYWRADNPSENTGCSVQPRPQTRGISAIGFLAALGFLFRRANRRLRSHLSS